MNARALFLAVACSGVALAQQNTSPTDASTPPVAPGTVAGKQPPGWTSMSITDKLKYDGLHLFDVDNIIYAGIGASIDQWRDRPPEWGQGWAPFGERYASHIGYYIVQRSIRFPVQAIDHEDTRYFRSKRTSYKGRIGDALLQTVWRYSDDGGRMPAYSEFFGDYGAAAVSRLWWPDRFHNGKAIFVAGTDTILVDAGINVLHEFAPDVKRWLHLGR